MTMKFECPAGKSGKAYTMTAPRSLGLSYKAQTCTGLGKDTTVKTIAKCSYGSSDEITNYVDSQFTALCIGKQSCDLQIDLNELFKND